MKDRFWGRHQSGMSLAETIIALGALGFVVLLGTNIFRTLQVANEGVDAMQEAISLKQSLLIGVDCQRTLFAPFKRGSASVPHPHEPNAACKNQAGKNYFEIVARVPTPIKSTSYPEEYAIVHAFKSDSLEFAAPYLKHIFVRASCVDCPVCIGGKTIKVEYQPRKKTISFLDYIKRKAGRAADMPVPWKDLFSGVPFGCVSP